MKKDAHKLDPRKGKLTLNKQSLRRLGQADLGRIHAANAPASYEYDGCSDPAAGWCW